MRFSTREDYAVALMANLAKQSKNKAISLRTIARQEHLPFLYLEQLASKLKASGLVVSRRGADGGYQLAKTPKQISFGDIVRALDNRGLMRCGGSAQCPRERFCQSRRVWDKLQTTLEAAMDRISIAELAQDHSSIRR